MVAPKSSNYSHTSITWSVLDDDLKTLKLLIEPVDVFYNNMTDILHNSKEIFTYILEINDIPHYLARELDNTLHNHEPTFKLLLQRTNDIVDTIKNIIRRLQHTMRNVISSTYPILADTCFMMSGQLEEIIVNMKSTRLTCQSMFAKFQLILEYTDQINMMTENKVDAESVKMYFLQQVNADIQ